MKKIAIITILDYDNYGNRLQNYALQEFLKEFNSQVVTLTNIPFDSVFSKRKKITQKLKKISIKKIKSKFVDRITNAKYVTYKKERMNNFNEFTLRNIIEESYSDSSVQVDQKYDYFVVGSDQIWNPNFRNGNANDFLKFASVEKRISYAPSFGISEIPSEYKNEYKTMIEGIPFLSVRENAGQKIIKELTGRESHVLLDPTLMISAEKWAEVANQSPVKPSKKYLLTYFLGEISAGRNETINNIAKEKKLEIINISDLNCLEYYSVDPSGFLSLIRSSEIFLTDSFHGVVFSIIFNKNFVVFEREDGVPSMNSRIDTILSTFNMKKRKWASMEKEDLWVSDYSESNLILEKEIQKSRKFMNEALGTQ
ncbi:MULTISPECIES: polysaccharide pyruvyl transferase family protein [Exiguobacterium]|uniref:polysaccharide pyruvyl transferase family protein n=1 Tax=Exiguobacterium TaxID=33986 RepID=UPI001BE8B4CB|nr:MULTISPECIES: polysaccharide pyruvyl transferase family protein [Exiguobacterium]MCT4777084.1 polysaccharide pyruvyl transferase family protein [Exiguobacterium aquaticum]MCT4789856.1 polysaccharide pyruvyl transferase family protein [Exiguobacterium mexicanum]